MSLGHHRRVGIDPPLVKTRHDQLMLPLPRLPVVRNQAVAEERLPHLLDHLRLVDVLRVRDVDRVNDLGIANEVRASVEDAGSEDVAVALVAFQDEVGRPPLEVEGAAPEPMAFVLGDRARGREVLPEVGAGLHLLNIK